MKGPCRSLHGHRSYADWTGVWAAFGIVGGGNNQKYRVTMKESSEEVTDEEGVVLGQTRGHVKVKHGQIRRRS